MTVRELYRISGENYRKNGFISHVIHFLLILLCSAFLLLGLFWNSLNLIVVPFIVIPTFFATELITILLRDQSYLTFKGFMRCFGSYFSTKFASTFRVIKSTLWSLLVYIIFALIYGLSVNLSLYYINFMGYKEVIDELLTYTSITVDQIQIIIDKHEGLFNTLMIINQVPSLFVFTISFIFLSSRASISLFNRIETPELIGGANKIAHENVMKKYRKEFNKAYFSLNWPMYLIFIGGFALGAYLGYINVGTYNAVYTLGLAVAVFVTFGLYGPFYLANNEAIYISLKDKYSSELTLMKSQFTTSLEDLIKKMEDERDEKKDSDES